MALVGNGASRIGERLSRLADEPLGFAEQLVRDAMPSQRRLRRSREWDIVKRHPHFTHEILARVPVFSEFAYDASCHHERIDGHGYHRGVSGDGLSVAARIMATADIFDALSAARPYRDAMPIDQVLSIMSEGRGTQLCPTTVDALFSVTSRTGDDLTSTR